MIPHSITDTGLVFFARGRPYSVAKDNPRYETILELLTDPQHTADEIADSVDWVGVLDRVSGGRINTVDGVFCLDLEPLPVQWAASLSRSPESARILLVHPGDRIIVEGDTDCPDGEYVVAGLDHSDVSNTLYVEDDDACFWGYPANTSIKEIIHAVVPVS